MPGSGTVDQRPRRRLSASVSGVTRNAMQELHSVIEVELVGVRVELPANQPIVLLKEKDGPRYLPIWIGAVEATAIAFALQGVETPRPLTHDLIVDVLGGLAVELVAVHVTELRDGTFYAELHLVRDGEPHTISSRPSDAIAVASRLEGVPIYASESVMDEAGLEIETTEDGDVDSEEQVRQFREFLDEITPEDFKEGG
jgi:uncharacterized protein